MADEASIARGLKLIGRAFEAAPVADLRHIAVTASGAAGLALWSGPNPALAVVTGSNRAELACRGLGTVRRRRAGLRRRGAGCIARLGRGDAAPRTRLLTGGALAAPLPAHQTGAFGLTISVGTTPLLGNTAIAAALLPPATTRRLRPGQPDQGGHRAKGGAAHGAARAGSGKEPGPAVKGWRIHGDLERQQQQADGRIDSLRAGISAPSIWIRLIARQAPLMATIRGFCSDRCQDWNQETGESARTALTDRAHTSHRHACCWVQRCAGAQLLWCS